MKYALLFKNQNFKYTLLSATLLLGPAQSFADSPSKWTGSSSSDLRRNANWDNGVPYGGIAVFEGNGDNSPLSNRDGGISFEEMQFNASTDISVISSIQATGTVGVIVNPGITATFDIYEHQPLTYPPANVTVTTGPLGEGGGTVEYNLEGYGQLYASSGSADSTVVNVTMTEGNNYLEVSGTESSVFDNVSSDAETDEIHILSGANLNIRGSETNTISGVITGEGSLTKSGTGTLILDNDNTYTGDTLVSLGTLQINGSFTGDVTVETAATLKVNGDLTGNITGDESSTLQIEGSLVGNVTAGISSILQVNGSLTGSVITQASSTLKGSGTIHGNVTLGGIVAPGNSIGTLSVNNFTFTNASIFELEVNSSGSSDQIIATEEIAIAGTLNIIPVDLGFTSPQTYKFLQAGSGVSGAFSAVHTSVPALMAFSYSADEVSLSYVPFSAIGLQGNAKEAADCFISLSGSDVNTVTLELLSLSFSEIQQAFNYMQPSQFSGQTWTQISNALLVRSGYFKHLEDFSGRKDGPDDCRSTVWVDAIGQWQQQHKKQEQLGYNDWTGGVSIGADASYKKFQFGAAASYTHSGVHWSQSAGKSWINSYYGGLYGGWSGDVGYISFSSLGAYNHYNSSRHLSIGNIHRQANGSHGGWEFLAGLEGGALFKIKYCKLGPFGRFDYVYLWQNGYQEQGAGSLNLHIKSRQDQVIQSQAGIAFTNQYGGNSQNSYGSLISRLELGYINQTPLGKSDYQASFEGSTCEFSVSGWNFERNLGATRASLTYLSPSSKIGASLQYDGQFGAKYSNQSGKIYFNVRY